MNSSVEKANKTGTKPQQSDDEPKSRRKGSRVRYPADSGNHVADGRVTQQSERKSNNRKNQGDAQAGHRPITRNLSKAGNDKTVVTKSAGSQNVKRKARTSVTENAL